jgi:hypothetical protein
LGHELGRDPTGPLGKIRLIESYDLRHVDDGILRQTGAGGRKQNITRSIQQAGVRGEHNANDRPKLAAVERISLDYENRTPKAWLASATLLEVGPPNLAAVNYHSEELTLRLWAFLKGASMPLASSHRSVWP